MLAAAKAVFRPDLFDAALPDAAADLAGEPADGIGAFAGPPFDESDIAGYLAAWNSKRAPAS
jgi:NitT/TauT family transport system ATP-binding protein